MTQENAAKFPWENSYPVDITWNSDIPEKTMIELFDESVEKYGDRPFVNFLGKKLTYKEVGALVDRFAKGLQDQGIGKGSTVGVCLPNTPFYVIAYYGAMKAGARVANFNPTSPPDALAQQIRDSKTDMIVAVNLLQQDLYPNVEKAMAMTDMKKIIVCDFPDALPAKKRIAFKTVNKICDHTKWFPFLNKKVCALRDKMGVKETARVMKDDKHIFFADLINSKGKLKPVDIRPDDVALLQYTGGTTGVPKGAALTHKNLAANCQQAKLWFCGSQESAAQEKTLIALPFFHVFAMTVQMNLSMHLGDEMLILPKPDVKTILETVTAEKPSKTAFVPALYKKIIDCKGIENYDLSSLTTCLSGGAPCPETTMAEWKKLTGVDIVEGYGLSETSPIVIANPIKGEKKAGSIGLPLPATEVRFADIDFPDKSVPIHMEGEICLRGPQVMKEYFGRPDETVNVFDADGFFHTGDIGIMDKDGYIFITDRKKDMIIVNGFKAFPKKIEEAIRKFEGVSEVIVIGIENESAGETVKAFIQPKEGATIDPAALVEFLKTKLTAYELPAVKNIEFRDNLPLTQIGKPDKKPLKEEEKLKAAARKKAAAPKPPKAA